MFNIIFSYLVFYDRFFFFKGTKIIFVKINLIEIVISHTSISFFFFFNLIYKLVRVQI